MVVADGAGAFGQLPENQGVLHGEWLHSVLLQSHDRVGPREAVAAIFAPVDEPAHLAVVLDRPGVVMLERLERRRASIPIPVRRYGRRRPRASVPAARGVVAGVGGLGRMPLAAALRARVGRALPAAGLGAAPAPALALVDAPVAGAPAPGVGG
jgi:hypothetical protein